MKKGGQHGLPVFAESVHRLYVELQICQPETFKIT